MVASCVQQYGEMFDWMRDEKFVREIENDSIDLETIEDELQALRATQHTTTRQRIVSTLQRSPVQWALCVLVLLDVGIGIGQLLIDIHAVREQLTLRDDELTAILRHVCNDTCSVDSLSQAERDAHVGTVIHLLRTHPSLDGRHSHVTTHFRQSPVSSDSNLTTRQQHEGRGEVTASYSVQQHTAIPVQRHGNNKSRSAAVIARKQQLKYPPSSNTLSPSPPLLLTHNDEQPERVAYPSHVSRRKHLHDDEKGWRYNNTINETLNQMRDDNIIHLMLIAHILHCIGISILGILLLEDIIKIFAMGRDFFRHKIEIVDAIVISVSFVFDIIFLSDIYSNENEKAAAFVVIMLMWRIARITDSILITVKQRQEFRIRLQKSARRKAEKKLEFAEEDRQLRHREVQALRELCLKANVSREEVDSCNLKVVRRTSSTLNALSSVARLSLGMTMSLSSSAVELRPHSTSAAAAAVRRMDEAYCSPSQSRARVSTNALELAPLAARFFSRSVPATPAPSRLRWAQAANNQDQYSSLEEGTSHCCCTGDKVTATIITPPHDKLLHQRQSPVNVSGVRIIVDEGSDTDLHPRARNALMLNSSDMTAADSGFYSCLTANGFSAASSRRTSSSAGSDVYLLSSY